ncbi:helix-turn-helix transcriptional regulator [Propionibacterium sp.]|uniref:helix-turn-helix transcriptional regulator n=1 Tax=Propionibacterium sp. TaxID=1977903 RepID=UPI0039EC9607
MNSPVSAGGQPSPGESSARRQVLRELLGGGPATAAVLAERLGVTSTAVRRQLGVLLESGDVEEREHRERGPRGRGRPAKDFVITDQGRQAFHQGYDDLALQAMAALREMAGPQAVEALGQRRYDEVAADYQELREAEPTGDPVAQLAGLLDAKGYVARVDDSPAGAQLCQHHCPVAAVAAAYPELCEMETQVFSRLLGSRVQRLATIAHGDGICTTNVPSETVPDTPADSEDEGTEDHRKATSA